MYKKCKRCGKEHKNFLIDYCDECFTEIQKEEKEDATKC